MVGGCVDEAPTSRLGEVVGVAAQRASVAADDEAPRFGPADFVESSESRDPFRSHLTAADPGSALPCRHHVDVPANTYSLGELKLTGVVSGSTPRALLEDPSGFGWIVGVGDIIGQAECVRLDGRDVRMGWRVDRVASDAVTLVLENAVFPEIAPRTIRVSLDAHS
jgi:Tfp pilus assembly protein PilP